MGMDLLYYKKELNSIKKKMNEEFNKDRCTILELEGIIYIGWRMNLKQFKNKYMSIP